VFKALASELFGGSLKSEERLDAFSFFGSLDVPSLGDDLIPRMEDLLNLAGNISSRDKFELHVEIDGDEPLVIKDNSQASFDAMRAHLVEVESGSEVDVRFNVIKGKGLGWVSLYSQEDLASHWSGQALRVAIDALWTRFDDGIKFECFEEISWFGSSSIGFYPRGSSKSRNPAVEHRGGELAVFKENCYVQGLAGGWIPSDFWLAARSKVSGINDFFDRVASILCVAFLANSSNFDGSGSLDYRLVGYKSISGSVNSAVASPALSSLYKIYEWAYGPGASSDRIGLARNVISLHVDDIAEVTNKSGVWGAIQSNYQIYLKGNISAYLEVKSRIAELLVDASTKAHATAQNLVVALKGGVATMAAFILGVVVVNGVKDSGVEKFFSSAYLMILLVVIVVFTIWLEHEVRSARRTLSDSELAFEEILTGGYSKILHASEIRESLNPIADRNRTFLNDEVGRIRRVWALISLVVAIAFSAGCLFYAPASTPVPKARDFMCYLAESAPQERERLTGCLWPKFREGAGIAK